LTHNRITSVDPECGSLGKRLPLKYQVRSSRRGVEVRIGRYNWEVFLVSLAWSIAWAAVALFVYRSWWAATYAGFMVYAVCALFCGFGFFLAFHALVVRTLILSSSAELGLETAFLGIARSKTIDPTDVIGFGFALASHSSAPVLRLELKTSGPRTKWIRFAGGITESEVNSFLQDIEAHGFRLPR
jgi:hypothetical protein